MAPAVPPPAGCRGYVASSTSSCTSSCLAPKTYGYLCYNVAVALIHRLPAPPAGGHPARGQRRAGSVKAKQKSSAVHVGIIWTIKIILGGEPDLASIGAEADRENAAIVAFEGRDVDSRGRVPHFDAAPLVIASPSSLTRRNRDPVAKYLPSGLNDQQENPQSPSAPPAAKSGVPRNFSAVTSTNRAALL